MKQAVTNFESLKIDNGGDTMMDSDAIHDVQHTVN